MRERTDTTDGEKRRTKAVKPIDTRSSALLSTRARSKSAFSINVQSNCTNSQFRVNEGHYVAMRKHKGDWYFISDEKVIRISDDMLCRINQGQLFFLRRSDS